MSFDVNFGNNLSSVQASAKTCSGGGGNTGYFSRNPEEEKEEILTFTKDYPEDSFERENVEDEIQNQSFFTIIKNLILDFLEAIKNFFIKK